MWRMRKKGETRISWFLPSMDGGRFIGFENVVGGNGSVGWI